MRYIFYGMSKKQGVEQPRVHDDSKAEGSLAQIREFQRPAFSVLDNPRLRTKADYENNVKIVNAYFEECIQHRGDGVSFDDEKRSQDLEFFSHLYKDDPDKIPRDIDTLSRIKKGFDQGSFFARVVEMILWQAQRDYNLFGDNARVTPTSEFDDLTKGVDLVVEIPVIQQDESTGEYTRRTRPLGVDMTKRVREDSASAAALDVKAHDKFSRGKHEEGYFRRNGVFRHLDYLKTPLFPGYESGKQDIHENTPGLELPVVVVSLTEQDLFDYCRIVIDEDTRKPRDPKSIFKDPKFHAFRKKIFDLIATGVQEQIGALSSQRNAYQQNNIYRTKTAEVSSELHSFESDEQILNQIADSMRAEQSEADRAEKVLSISNRIETSEETAVMVENAAAAIRSNTEKINMVVQKMKAIFAPDIAKKVDTISEQEKDKARKDMIQELLSGIPVPAERIRENSALFLPLHAADYRVNNMLLAGIRPVLISQAKRGDVFAGTLVADLRILKNKEEIVAGFERMMADTHAIAKNNQGAA